jgi:hypothetical protein
MMLHSNAAGKERADQIVVGTPGRREGGHGPTLESVVRKGRSVRPRRIMMSMVLRIVNNLRIHAVMATLRSFPALVRRR